MINNTNFINAMNSSCKMMTSSLSIDGVEYPADNIVSINPYYEGSLLCSVMKCCDIEIQFDETIDSDFATAFKGQKVTNIKIGAKQEADTEYAIIELDEYKIYSAEYREESNSVYLVCYDSMLDSMVPYNLEFAVDVTVREYLEAICSYIGWQLAAGQFVNENIVLSKDSMNSYLIESNGDAEDGVETINSPYTFRDALDSIAEIIAGNLIFKSDGLLYVVYPSVATVDNEVLKLSADNQQSMAFKSKFGPVNSVAIIQSDDVTAIVLDDSESIAADGKCQIKIVDNILMNNKRSEFVNGIFSQLNGLSYIPYEFTSFGFGYIEFGDIFDLEDVKGNLKRTVMLSDNFLLSETVREVASATFYSADSDTDYNVAGPIDKVKVDIKRLQSASTNLIERVANAENSIAKAVGGHVLEVDLQYDESTGLYYVGDGAPNNMICSENPAVANESEPNDFTTGRVVRINYNGITVSTSGIGGPYIDFAVYFDNSLKKYLVNADDIAVGTLQGIKAILEEGSIGGFTIGTWKDASSVQHEGLKKTFKFTNTEGGTYCVTFAIDSTSGSSTAPYVIQLYESDANGVPTAGSYSFALSTEGVIEIDTIFCRKINYIDDEGWIDIAYTSNFENFYSSQPLQYRRVGNLVELRGVARPTTTLPIASTDDRYIIGYLDEGYRPDVMRVEPVCQGSGTDVWTLSITATGAVRVSRHRSGQTYKDLTTTTYMPIHVMFFVD